MRLIRSFAIATLLLGLAFPATSAPLEPYPIHAILSLTGGAAFTGNAAAVSLRAAEAVINQTGGIRGRPVHFVVEDDQTKPAVAVQLISKLIAQHVTAIIGPRFTATCSAVLPLVSAAGPVQYCLVPSVHPPANSYSFSAGFSSKDSVLAELRYARNRGWHRIALLTSTDATGQDGEQNVRDDLSLRENGKLTLVANEHFNTSDITVAAQLTRIQAAKPDVLFALTTGTPFGQVLKGLSQGGIDTPVLTNSGNVNGPEMEQYAAILPKQLYFSAMVGLVADVARPLPIRRALTQFYEALKAQGVAPDDGYVTAWDPTMIVVDALRHVGPDATAAEIHSYIERLHGFAGINGIYDFRDGSQRGLSIDAVVVVRWDPSNKQWLAVSRPGGLKL